MSAQDRLHRYLKGITNPLSVVSSAAAAGIGQWRDTPVEWGQGGDAYGRRFASSYAKHMVQQTLEYGFASAFHEDNLYVRSGESGFWPRLRYAITSTFLARKNDGTRRISFSHIGAIAGASFISRAWQPASTASAGDGAANFGVSIGVAVGYNVAREFLPRLR